MKRRRFLGIAGAFAANACFPPKFLWGAEGPENDAQTLRAILTVDESSKAATVPADFTGLSYESAQLANPAFFAPANKGHEHWVLTGPAMDAKQDVGVTKVRGNALQDGTLRVASHSAVLIRA